MKIIINDVDINVIIIYKKIKNIYFRFDDDLNLKVSANKWTSEKSIIKLIENNKTSILRMYQKTVNKIEETKDSFLYLGNKYKIVIDEFEEIRFYDEYVICPSIDALNNFYQKKSKELFGERIESIKNMYHELPEFSLKIRKMKTRWGVCNYSKNTITLNSELLKKDQSLIDYVIIHELCHFKYPNHSPSFWNEVAKYYPYYKQARKMLK